MIFYKKYRIRIIYFKNKLNQYYILFQAETNRINIVKSTTKLDLNKSPQFVQDKIHEFEVPASLVAAQNDELRLPHVSIIQH